MRTREFVARQLASVQSAPEGAEGRAEAIERLTKELASFPVDEPHHDRRDPCAGCRDERPTAFARPRSSPSCRRSRRPRRNRPLPGRSGSVRTLSPAGWYPSGA
jgi:hypothetical protein